MPIVRRSWIRLLPMFAASVLVSPLSLSAEPMRYLVFDWNEAGEPVLMLDRFVESLEPRSTVVHAGTDAHDIGVALVRAGKSAVPLATAGGTVLRVPATHDGHYATHEVPGPPQAFVVRAAMAEGDRIEVAHAGRRFGFDLGRSPGPVDDAAGKAASAINRVDVLIVGEGYTAADRSRFDRDVDAFEQDFFATSPYREYRSFIRIDPLFVASRQAGADHPAYRADCAGGAPQCCADADAKTDPAAGRRVDTAFDGTYCVSNIHRLLSVDYGKVFAAAAASPDWDFIFVLVNDAVYGGSGGAVAVASTGEFADAIVVHEFAHLFAGLADEYTTPYPGFQRCSDLQVAGAPRCEPNVTDELRRHRIKWRHFIPATTPLPTPPGTPGTGLFEGARYEARGMFRPQRQCLMGAFFDSFCAVCAETYILRMYGGGWGAPAGGIRLIEPGSESPPTDTVIDLDGAGIVLRAELLRPTHALDVFWRVDGRRLAGPAEPVLDLAALMLAPGEHRVELHVVDPNPMVRSGSAGALAQSRVWRVKVDAGATDALVNPMALTGLWYEPATSGQGVNLLFIDERHFLLTFYGYRNNGERLWLIGDFNGSIDFGRSLHFDLFEATGGVFEHLDPTAIRRPLWGSGELRIDRCNQAQLRMTGNDGSQLLDLVKIAGVAALDCAVR
jgi:hypothetical protein